MRIGSIIEGGQGRALVRALLVASTLAGLMLTASLVYGSASTERMGSLPVRDGGAIIFYAQADDEVVPIGAKVISVVIKNESEANLPLGKLTDSWTVVDSKGRTHKARFSELNINTAVWARMSKEEQKLFGYPRNIPSGTYSNIYLVVEPEVELKGFRELIFKSLSLEKPLRINRHISR